MADTEYGDFQTFIAKERERLQAEREAIFTQQHELEIKLAAINREMAAITAYEDTKSGKAASAVRGLRAIGIRRGSKRDGILAVLGKHPDGLSRGGIIEALGLKGNKAGEMSVSNALTALTKANQVTRKDGKYTAT